MSIDPRPLLPRHKSDTDQAHAVIALGYPAVAPVLEWLQDGNWPVSHPIGDFLASVGAPVVPLVREVFRGSDDIWKYWCILRVVQKLPPPLAERLRPELTRFARCPSASERSEEVDVLARQTLAWLDGKGEALPGPQAGSSVRVP